MMCLAALCACQWFSVQSANGGDGCQPLQCIGTYQLIPQPKKYGGIMQTNIHIFINSFHIHRMNQLKLLIAI